MASLQRAMAPSRLWDAPGSPRRARRGCAGRRCRARAEDGADRCEERGEVGEVDDHVAADRHVDACAVITDTDSASDSDSADVSASAAAGSGSATVPAAGPLAPALPSKKHKVACKQASKQLLLL